MRSENKFGKWGAWVAAAGLAIGGGHEMLKDNEQNKPKTEVVDDDITQEETDKEQEQEKEPPKENTPKTDAVDQTTEALKQLDKMKEKRKKEINDFIKYNDHQLKQKLTQQELEEWHKKMIKLEGEEAGERDWEDLQDELNEKTKKMNEYVGKNPRFDQLKKVLEQKFPNMYIYPVEVSNGFGKFNIEQYIFTEEDDGEGGKTIVERIAEFNLDIDQNGYYTPNKFSTSFVPWSASDEETFIAMFEKQIQAGLLEMYYYKITKFETMLDQKMKSDGFYEQFKDILINH